MEKVFLCEEEIAQGCGGCSIPRDFQGKAGPCSEQHDLAVVVPVNEILPTGC